MTLSTTTTGPRLTARATTIGNDRGDSRQSLASFSRTTSAIFSGRVHDKSAERLGALARSTIECIAQSDALCHNVEHTMLVTIVGRDILRGRTLIAPDRAL